MLVYLIDDRGPRGEYANFLHAYQHRLPPIELRVFTHWQSLYEAIQAREPQCLLVDLRFDETAREELYGDLEALVRSDRFCGNTERAELWLREMQGLLIVRALRQENWAFPIILFASVNECMKRQLEQGGPTRIIEGLLLEELREALLSFEHYQPSALS